MPHTTAYVSACCCMCPFRIPLYICPVEPQVSAYCYICARILLYVSACYDVFAYNCMCPVPPQVSAYYYVCVRMLLCVRMLRYVSACYAVSVRQAAGVVVCILCVRILLYMCPHTTIYVSSYYYMCPHTTVFVLILLYMCPRSMRSSTQRRQRQRY